MYLSSQEYNLCIIVVSLILKGLLIEPNVKSYKKLLKKNRHVKSINACLSRTQFPELVNFINADGISGLDGKFI